METALDSAMIARVAADAALSRRARDVTILDLREVAAFTDFFVLCTGTSDTHIAGIADIVLEKMEEIGQRPWHLEGERHADWVLLDYIDVVVHIFSREAREFYALERLWVDATAIVLSEDDVELDPTWQESDEEAPTWTTFTAMDDWEEE